MPPVPRSNPLCLFFCHNAIFYPCVSSSGIRYRVLPGVFLLLFMLLGATRKVLLICSLREVFLRIPHLLLDVVFAQEVDSSFHKDSFFFSFFFFLARHCFISQENSDFFPSPPPPSKLPFKEQLDEALGCLPA